VPFDAFEQLRAAIMRAQPPKPSPSTDVGALVERLRERARTASKISRQMAEAKSLRQSDNPERRSDLYMWEQVEQTLEWQAADEIERLAALSTEAFRDAFREDNGDKDWENPVEAPTATREALVGQMQPWLADVLARNAAAYDALPKPIKDAQFSHIAEAALSTEPDRPQAEDHPVARVDRDTRRALICAISDPGFIDEDRGSRSMAEWTADALIAAGLIPSQPRETKGMVLVPREPTEADIERVARAIAESCSPDENPSRIWKAHADDARAAWSAMIAAAPTNGASS